MRISPGAGVPLRPRQREACRRGVSGLCRGRQGRYGRRGSIRACRHGQCTLQWRRQEVREFRRRQRSRSRDQGQGVSRPPRSLRLRQDDDHAHGRRSRGDHRGRHLYRRPARQRRAAEISRRGDGLPVLRALPAPDGRRQYRLPAEDPEGAEARAAPDRQRGGQAGRARRPPGAAAQGALRRPAAARGAGPRHRAHAQGLPDGRAALQPRRQAPRARCGRS